jgi:hypothetical protein
VTRDEDFLSRWSRRKHAVRRGESVPEAHPDRPAAGAVPAQAATPFVPPPSEPVKEVDLPPVESLTPESDFTAFMQDGVDPGLRRQALRTLFRDPRFNVMDGLDVYIDDYSKPDPIPPDWLGKLNQMARLGDYRPPEPESAQGPSGEEPPPTDPIHTANQDVADQPAAHPPGPEGQSAHHSDLKESEI